MVLINISLKNIRKAYSSTGLQNSPATCKEGGGAHLLHQEMYCGKLISNSVVNLPIGYYEQNYFNFSLYNVVYFPYRIDWMQAMLLCSTGGNSSVSIHPQPMNENKLQGWRIISCSVKTETRAACMQCRFYRFLFQFSHIKGRCATKTQSQPNNHMRQQPTITNAPRRISEKSPRGVFRNPAITS